MSTYDPPSTGNGCSSIDQDFVNFTLGGSQTLSAPGTGLPTTADLSVLGIGTSATGTGTGAPGIRITSTGATNDWQWTEDSSTDGLAWNAETTFAVTTTGTNLIYLARLGLDDIVLSGAYTGAGAGVLITGVYCPGTTSWSVGCADQQTVSFGSFTTTQAAGLNGSVLFAGGVSSMAVRFNINVDLGTSDGNRGFELGFAEFNFEEAPEPSTWFMLSSGLGMVGVAYLIRRRKLAKAA